MITSIQIGEKIAIARKLKNMSQSDVANRMFLTTQAIGKWERGESIPDAVTFVKLSEVLGVELNFFIGKESQPNAEIETPHDCENLKKQERNMSGGSWANADFSGLKDIGEKFSGANIENCQFIKADLSNLTVRGNNIQDSDFSDANMSGSYFKGCNIQNCVFASCNMSRSENHSSSIGKCNFDDADLSGAIFSHCNLEKISVVGVKWSNMAFRATALTNIDFSGEMTGCSFEGLTRPTRVVFRNAVMRNTFFKNCNLKKLRFENVCADAITLAFLKNSNADISEIKVMN
ncbi:MAG: pentapeptide repeat-containing protein [Dysgonamonadaceae bacterium]|nr:pentapeptide repeat-containing protein [Dysgonamonadaceae bacterium]